MELFEVTNTSSRVFRADGRLVNMSGVFCTNNTQEERFLQMRKRKDTHLHDPDSRI